MNTTSDKTNAVRVKKDDEQTSSTNKRSNLEEYTNKLLTDAIQLRSKYFDENLNIKNLKWWKKEESDKEKYYDFKKIINSIFSKDETIKEAVKLTSTPKAKELAEKYEKDLLQMFTHLLELVHHPSRNIAAGHDSVHTAYDGYEILNYIKGIDNPVEEIATYFWSLLHDLWRTDEIEFKWWQQLDDSHALYSLIYLFQELRSFKKRFYKEHNNIKDEEKKRNRRNFKSFF